MEQGLESKLEKRRDPPAFLMEMLAPSIPILSPPQTLHEELTLALTFEGTKPRTDGRMFIFRSQPFRADVSLPLDICLKEMVTYHRIFVKSRYYGCLKGGRENSRGKRSAIFVVEEA
ncbi:hypothetical protein Tco_0847615 [Tanacetum coccineum]